MVKQPDDVLAAAGFEFLNKDTDANSLNGLLEGLVKECESLAPLAQEIVQAAAIQALKKAGIARPVRLVNTAFGGGR